jgi:hypothetical protein
VEVDAIEDGVEMIEGKCELAFDEVDRLERVSETATDATVDGTARKRAESP